MIKYRITKYNPKFRNNQGWYLKDEWISYGDIGKVYDGVMLTVESYLKTERNYVYAALAILNRYNVTKVTLYELELRSTTTEMNNLLKPKGLKLTNQDASLIKSLSNGKVFSIIELERVIPLILRECFWCKFVSKNPKCIVEFGYDYYMYISGNEVPKNLVDDFKDIGIYVENTNKQI